MFIWVLWLCKIYFSLTTEFWIIGRILEMAGFLMIFTAGSKKDIKVWTRWGAFFFLRISRFLCPIICPWMKHCFSRNPADWTELWSVIFEIKMRDALKLFSFYVSFDMVYIKAVLGCAEEKMFHFLSVFLTSTFFFFLRLTKDIMSVLKYLFIQICT